MKIKIQVLELKENKVKIKLIDCSGIYPISWRQHGKFYINYSRNSTYLINNTYQQFHLFIGPIQIGMEWSGSIEPFKNAKEFKKAFCEAMEYFVKRER